MRRIVLKSETDWEGWRQATRSLILSKAEPADLVWTVGGEAEALPEAAGTFHVPRALVSLASLAIQARHPDRFSLLYSLVWRINAGENLLDDDADPEFALAKWLSLSVRADAHKMRTNMRFLPVQDGGETRYLGWYEPAHFVVPANAQLITRRFAGLPMSIITPDGAAHWDRTNLLFGSGVDRIEDDAALQAWWETHRDTLLHEAVAGTSVPEAEALDEMPRSPDRPALGPVVLHTHADESLSKTSREAAVCKRCPLFEPATQTVFGEGPEGATAMFVGEQPGDQEDTIGRPFVGPAGQMMDRAMEEAGIDRRTIYVTNAVKHFKFTPRGKRRIHQTPETPEIKACQFWLDSERAEVRPKLLVLMGGTAARAGMGRVVTIGRERGKPIQMANGQTAFITVHPSYLLRIPDAEAKAREYEAFVRDLRTIRELMEADSQPR